MRYYLHIHTNGVVLQGPCDGRLPFKKKHSSFKVSKSYPLREDQLFRER